MERLSEAVFAGVLLKIFFQKVLENAQENTNHQLVGHKLHPCSFIKNDIFKKNALAKNLANVKLIPFSYQFDPFYTVNTQNEVEKVKIYNMYISPIIGSSCVELLFEVCM